MRTICLFALFFHFGIAHPSLALAAPPSCDTAQKMLSTVSAIRGLSPKTEVPCVVATREDIRKFLVETIKEKLPPEKVKREEVVYKALGVIPESFEYEKGIVDLYVSQIGGYYDPEKKHFVMADWIPEGLQAEVAVHELTHALQDQHYDLEKMLDPKQENGDMLLAYAALVEGDAMLVMTDRVRAQSGKGPLQEESSLDSIVPQQERKVSSGAQKDHSAIPETLQKILMFPYTEGVRFSHTLLRSRKGYQGIDASFKSPPQSTREILHPELYLDPSSLKATIPPIDEFVPRTSGAKVVYSEIIGEFIIQATLCSSALVDADCKLAAQGWLGDRVVVFEGDTPQREVLWITKWESRAEADEFLVAYKKVLEERYRATFTPADEAAFVIPGKGVKIQSIGSAVAVTILQ